jgi:hypothetical protein
MKKTNLVFLSVAFLISWCQAISQEYNSLVGTGYPTSMGPCCNVVNPNINPPKLPASGASPSQAESRRVNDSRRVAAASQPSEKPSANIEANQGRSVAASGLLRYVPGPDITITDGNNKPIDPNNPPSKPAPPLQMDYKIRIDSFLDKCGTGNFQVGYVSNDDSLPLFRVSILQSSADPLFAQQWNNNKPTIITASGGKRFLYSLPQSVVGHLKGDSTLRLQATGFQTIYLAVWCGPLTTSPNTIQHQLEQQITIPTPKTLPRR